MRKKLAPDSQDDGFTSNEEGNNQVQVSVFIPYFSEISRSSKDPSTINNRFTLKDLKDAVALILKDINDVFFSL